MNKKSGYQSVIFDLDGTLIDSSPTIIACLEQSLHNEGIKPTVPLDSRVIGPPLRETLMMLAGPVPETVIDRLVTGFKEFYDSEGYKSTAVFAGINELLHGLFTSGISISIATNKRRVPTLKILKYLGWERFFDEIGTLDNPLTPQSNKANLLASMLKSRCHEAQVTPYIGDKLEDGEAADANGMPFYAATWGYGDWKLISRSSWKHAGSPTELMDLLIYA